EERVSLGVAALKQLPGFQLLVRNDRIRDATAPSLGCDGPSFCNAVECAIVQDENMRAIGFRNFLKPLNGESGSGTQIESARPHQHLNLRNFREHPRCALGGILRAQTIVVLLDNVSCCEKLLKRSLVQRGLRFRARGEGQEGTPLWNIVKQLCAIRRKQCNSSALLVRFKAFLGYSTYSLHPVISNADLNAVKLGVARSQVRVGNMPPAARDF